ncbi:S66 family peptidase [Haloglycomyces albus]|uniref:S66 family peptidase n=1 Tax=Haloglycomyces albus TaxID=526067 RepID=UPI001FE1CADB|nr:S66 peptidase family protein [Haloglycomyces albus]
MSPSSALPAVLPLPYELGLQRLRDDFGLDPVEYPTTRKLGAAPRERAEDVNSAFADPSIKAVIASIGGDDQITVLPHLDRDTLAAGSKPFFGSSDNTNLLAYLASLGVVGYYGGCVMTCFGRPGAMHPDTESSLRSALFSRGEFVLPEIERYTTIDRDWADPTTFMSEPPTEPHPTIHWHHCQTEVEGQTWGGCLEIVSWLLMADQCVPDDFSDIVLFLETSEEMPSDIAVYRMLRNMGERGILKNIKALVWGTPKASSHRNPLGEKQRVHYHDCQYAAVARSMEEYAPRTPWVWGVDFGHTDPQLTIPYGGRMRLGLDRTITVTY